MPASPSRSSATATARHRRRDGRALAVAPGRAASARRRWRRRCPVEVLAHPLLERVDADAQRQVEHHRAVLDQQEPVAGPAVGDGRAVAVRWRRSSTPSSPSRSARVDPRRPTASGRFHGGRATGSIGSVARASHARRWPSASAARSAAGTRPHAVARRQLAELPALAAATDGRAHEPAEAGAVGAEDDRHVTGEVDGADGVRRCRGCSTGAGRPRRRRRGAHAGLRPDEAHAGAGRVEVHLATSAREEGVEAVPR